MKVTLEFSGGAELLVGKIKKHNVELPEKNEWTLEGLLAWVSRYHTNINIDHIFSLVPWIISVF